MMKFYWTRIFDVYLPIVVTSKSMYAHESWLNSIIDELTLAANNSLTIPSDGRAVSWRYFKRGNWRKSFISSSRAAEISKYSRSRTCAKDSVSISTFRVRVHENYRLKIQNINRYTNLEVLSHHCLMRSWLRIDSQTRYPSIPTSVTPAARRWKPIQMRTRLRCFVTRSGNIRTPSRALTIFSNIIFKGNDVDDVLGWPPMNKCCIFGLCVRICRIKFNELPVPSSTRNVVRARLFAAGSDTMLWSESMSRLSNFKTRIFEIELRNSVALIGGTFKGEPRKVTSRNFGHVCITEHISTPRTDGSLANRVSVDKDNRSKVSLKVSGQSRIQVCNSVNLWGKRKRSLWDTCHTERYTSVKHAEPGFLGICQIIYGRSAGKYENDWQGTFFEL